MTTLELSRRSLIQKMAVGAGTLAVSPWSVATVTNTDRWRAPKNIAAQTLAEDEAYWAEVRDQYWLPEGVVQLENGNWGVMSKPVLAAYQQHSFELNRDSSYYSRRNFYTDYRRIRAQVAQLLAAEEEEIAFARGATEVLQSLIGGYRNLQAGDTVMISDIDYDSMQTAMAWLQQRRGVKLAKIALPEAAPAEDIITVYRRALEQYPQTKLLLLTHLSHRHGMVLPVREIVAMARDFGVDCIVDAAHSLGQMDFDVADLGADFVGFNFHKWMGAPLGVGVMYIRKSRLDAIEPFMGERGEGINARLHTGTFNYAALLAVPAALNFHRGIGAANKAARLHYLRNYWVRQLRADKRVKILTADGAANCAGITSLRAVGRFSSEENQALAKALLTRKQVFTVHRDGLAAGSCLRVTPALFTSTADLDQLIAGITQVL